MKTGKEKGKAVGELKPPKIKTNDEDRQYVQRPTGEQFRPPPFKPKP
jgi:DnaJ family protein C protein 8